MSVSDPAVLVVGPSWVGDMVMAHSLFQRLAERSPKPRIHVLAPGWTRPLLERMPEVAGSVEMPLGHGSLGLGQRRRLGHELRAQAFDQAIVLPNSLKSALVPWWAKIPQRSGWRGEYRYGLLNDLRPLDKQALPMTVQRFLALAEPPGNIPDSIPEPRLHVDQAQADQAMQALGLEKQHGRPVLALCPGAEYGPAKQWPTEHFARLSKERHAAGWDVWLFGSAKDQPVCAAINTASGGACRDLAGRTSLGQAIDLLAQADAVVSNDSGLMHVAAAVQSPLVALYGSSDPSHTPPLGKRKRILYLNLDCSPCFKRDCPLGHTRCLQDIGVGQVQQAIDELRA